MVLRNQGEKILLVSRKYGDFFSLISTKSGGRFGRFHEGGGGLGIDLASIRKFEIKKNLKQTRVCEEIEKKMYWPQNCGALIKDIASIREFEIWKKNLKQTRVIDQKNLSNRTKEKEKETQKLKFYE
ncbi:Uncharacterized protein Fot_37673 [Forsythia ovata]|uniref:Uncharacterized protein n=1 Tax=Forsythia ovata TaxID=205694 RepID=A0ABD1RZM8_9LAMI